MEHAPLHAGEREDRQVHDHDDQLAVQQRTARLLRCREHLGKPLGAGELAARLRLRVRQAPHAVLDDHHRAIDNDAEVQRTKAQQIGADLEGDHAGKGKQHRQRDHHGGNQRRANITEEDKQHRDHQHRPFQQVFPDRVDRLVHQHGAVVHGDRFYSGRQAAVDLHHFSVHRLRHGAAVLADQHEHRTEHHLAAVLGGSSRAQFAPDQHLGHVAHAHRHPAGVGQDDVADVVQRLHLARRAYQQLLAALFDVAGAGVAVVAVERRHHVLQGQAIRCQALRIGRHLVFLGIAADGIDLGHARHVAQLRLDDPVLDLAQVGRRVWRAVSLFCALLRFHRPQVDFTEAGGNRPHRRRHAGR